MSITSISNRAFQQVARKTPVISKQQEHLPSEVARKQLLSYTQLKNLVLSYNSPFLGIIPEELSQITSANDHEIAEGLNWLAGKLQQPNAMQTLKPSLLKSVYGTFVDHKNPIKRLFQKN
jgi:hypothetical protein